MSNNQADTKMFHDMIRRSVSAVLLMMIAIVPASAIESPWAQTEGARMRLVIDPEPQADGVILGVVEVDLEPGWKTYWREPGSAGIPPLFDFSQSKGIVLEALHYPPPVRVDDGYAVWAGYTAPVRFPVSLRRTASGQANVRALAFIGVCEKICVPFQTELTVDLPDNATASDTAKAMVAEAVGRLPEAAGSDFNIQSVQIDAGGTQLEVAAQLPAFRPSKVAPELFVAGARGYAFAQPNLLEDENGVVRWSVPIEAVPEDLEQNSLSSIDVVVTLGQRAMGATLGHDKAITH